MNVEAIMLIVIGLFVIMGAAFNWDWFMDHRKARFISWALGGRDRARFFYYMMGAGLVVLGVAGMFQLVDLSS